MPFGSPSFPRVGTDAHRPPLSGVRVLDLTRLLPGPACTMHLADLGADVVKIEDTTVGDYAPPSMRVHLHRNKRAMQLDLKQAAGVQAFLALARDADVVIESFRPGVMGRLGVGYEPVAQANPRIVYCSLSGYGQIGPLSQAAGHDMNYCDIAGVSSQIGHANAQPALSNVPLADLLGGAMTAAMGILAALVDARASGRGRHVDVAMADSVLAQAIMPLAASTRHGTSRPAGCDTLTGALPCYTHYRTLDGRWLGVAALERKFWDTFCDRLGRPEMKAQHRSEDSETSRRVRSEVASLIEQRTLADWQRVFADADCCVSAVLSLEEALAHEHFVARGSVVASEHPVYGRAMQVASPVRMSGFDWKIERHAPLPGEHSDEVLREVGYLDADIAKLRQQGVLG